MTDITTVIHTAMKEADNPYKKISFLKRKIEENKHTPEVVNALRSMICEINNENFNEEDVDIDEILSGDIENDRQEELLEELTE